MARWDDDDEGQFQLVGQAAPEPAWTPCEESGHDFGPGRTCTTCGEPREEGG